tara:strand:- start:297 stop:1601 length:1305 start_codon:yes stop_codon:yes gene_type:complete
MSNLKTISGWGLYPKTESNIYEIKDIEENINYLSNEYIARGNGRSYGDSSLGTNIISTLNLNRIIKFDKKNGKIILQSGVLLNDIINLIVPEKWFLPVSPGTKFISIGGAIASDIHGKNHHLVGCISNYVTHLKIFVPDQGEIYCDNFKNNELFNNTFGGMGLTGLILEVGLNLLKIQSTYIEQTTIKTQNLRETFDIMEQNLNKEYSVCWIDTSAQKHNLGRGLVYLGKHSTDKNMHIKKLKQIEINKKFIPKLCSNYLFKILNFIFYKKNFFKIKKEKVYFDDYFYPLDKIKNWNYFYGKKGFLQYQFCIPLENSYDGILEILKEIQKNKNVSFTSVLKLMGDQNKNTLSFPFKGYTLALDFPRDRNIFELLDRLDEIILKYDGKVYLTKDSRLKKESFVRMYKNYKIFYEFRKKNNLFNKIKSFQSMRLDI